MKKLTALLLVLAVMLFAFAGCKENADKTATSTPTATATKPAGTQDAPGTNKTTEQPTLAEKLQKGFTFTCEVKDKSNLFLPSDISVKLVCDNENEKSLVTAKLPNSDGSPLELGLYSDKDILAVSAPAFFDGTYGVKLSTLKDDFANSVFAPISGSSLAFDEETYTQILGYIDTLTGDSSADMQKIYDKITEYAGVIIELVKKQVTFETKDGVLTVNVKLDNDALAGIVEKLADIIENDETLKEILGSLVSGAEAGYDDELGDLGAITDITDGMSLKEIADEIRNGDKFSLVFDGTFSEKEGKCTLTVNDVKYAGAEYTVTEENGDIRLNAHVHTFDGETENDILVIDGSKIGETVKATVTLRQDGENVASAECELKDNTYVVTVNANGQTYVVYGKIEITDSHVLFGIDKFDMTNDGMNMTIDLSIVVRIDSEFETPAAPEYSNILALGEEEMTELVTKIGDAVSPSYPDFTDDIDYNDDFFYPEDPDYTFDDTGIED